MLYNQKNECPENEHKWVMISCKFCSDCEYRPNAVEDLTGSDCYECICCETWKCEKCGKEEIRKK